MAQWAGVTAAAAVTATCFDALLLQYRRSYFTGGFLARDFVTSPSQAFAFFSGSLLTDAAAAGLIVWAVLMVLGRLAVPRALALGAAFLLALVPVFIADFVEYQLMTYLGDAFDLRLLFELTDRSPGEILAVSSAHLTRAAWLALGTVIPAALALWVVSRRMRMRSGLLIRAPFWRSLSISLAVFICGAIVMTLLRSGSDVVDNGLRRKPTGRFLGVVVEAATDLDRDGSGALGRPDDPNLFDRRVRPYALDVPGNGIDEDGVGGDLPAGAEPYSEGIPPSPWRVKPDVVLVLLEGVRADVRGARLDGKAVTPVLDELAAQGIAPLAYSHNGYTVQSRRHIFSGSIPDIRGNETLIDDFKQQGYEVAYFSGQDESFGGPQQGVGFERADVAYDARADRDLRYSDFSTAGSLAVPYSVVVERIGEFLDGRRSNKPVFLYVNFHDTHFPYHHRGIRPLISSSIVQQADIAPEHADRLRAMYMNTTSNVDRAIGEILERVRKTVGREPGVIVLSDHGESLFDESFLGHGYTLNDAQTRIPLIVSGLPIAIEEPFAQSDLRDAIRTALSQPLDHAARPTLSRNRTRMVFQYLGLIPRPAQIALTGIDGQTTYDFRERRARVGSGEWRRPEDLNPQEYSVFLELIHSWERMMLARDAASSVD
jgi:glucan phosphoethanolaminetransferase (alkaline phosphatase superfamily)